MAENQNFILLATIAVLLFSVRFAHCECDPTVAEILKQQGELDLETYNDFQFRLVRVDELGKIVTLRVFRDKDDQSKMRVVRFDRQMNGIDLAGFVFVSEIEFTYLHKLVTSTDVKDVPQLRGEAEAIFEKLDGVKYFFEWNLNGKTSRFWMWEYHISEDITGDDFIQQHGVDRDAAKTWMDLVAFLFDIAGLTKSRQF